MSLASARNAAAISISASANGLRSSRLREHAQQRLDLGGGGGAAVAGPRHEELVGVDRLGDRAGKRQVGIGVLGGQIEVRHGEAPGKWTCALLSVTDTHPLNLSASRA